MLKDFHPDLALFKGWFSKHKERIKEDLFQFLRFKSISTDKSFRRDMQACADWLVQYVKNHGVHAELVSTSTVPIVFAEMKPVKKEAHTLLVYGHYDVQPVDPIELWHSDPFEPVEREGQIYARGASDDKGQIFYALTAAFAWFEMKKEWPIHLKFCIEGEEESQSTGLSEALPRLKEKFQADSLLIVDFDQLQHGPCITLGARGMAALEVTLTGSSTDLHSGVLGGVAYNPNRALAELLSRLYDEKGRVQVPHFYDDIDEEDGSLYAYPYDASYFQKAFKIAAFGGEKGKTLQEANWLRPTLEINGIVGGYTGHGIKTVIPSKATAKLSMRLVPSQNPHKILKSLESFLKQNVVQGMDVQVELCGGEEAWRGDPRSKLCAALREAVEDATHQNCENILSGASIPVISSLNQALSTQVAGMGYALASDQIHAPNEHFDMHRFELGFLTFVRLIDRLKGAS